MRILLDTATFLWAVRSPSKLTRTAAALYQEPENELFLSAASTFEIVVKSMIGKLHLGESASSFVLRERASRDIASLPIDEEATFALERLPLIHSDPFDRLLIAQCVVHGLTLLSPDAEIARYPIRVAW